jgi:excinuclease ABC subunit B
MEIIRDLRLGKHDVLVGINLLREGLDLPEVSLIAILDADKEGFLRSETSLIQTIGRAARNIQGRVIMYGDKITGSMERAISETNRRRQLQHEYNIKNNITPRSIVKGVRKIIEATLVAEDQPAYEGKLGREEIEAIISGLEAAMLKAAEALEFEKAADIRDKIIELRKSIRD